MIKTNWSMFFLHLNLVEKLVDLSSCFRHFTRTVSLLMYINILYLYLNMLHIIGLYIGILHPLCLSSSYATEN